MGLKAVFLLTAASMAAIQPTETRAQQNDEAQAAPVSGLEVITVTARRRSENLQDTPVAVTALSGDALADRQATSITALSDLAPS